MAAMKDADIYIPNYKGTGGIFGDFVHCIRTRTAVSARGGGASNGDRRPSGEHRVLAKPPSQLGSRTRSNHWGSRGKSLDGSARS